MLSLKKFLRKWNYHINLYQKKRNVAVAFVKKVTYCVFTLLATRLFLTQLLSTLQLLKHYHLQIQIVIFRESYVAKLEVEMQEKDFHIQQQHMKSNQLSKELHDEQDKIVQLTDDLTSMKASLIAAAAEKERLFQEYVFSI